MSDLDPDRIKSFLTDVDEQDSIVTDISRRNGRRNGVPVVSGDLNRTIEGIFELIEDYAPGLVQRYSGHGDPETVRSKLRAARNRLQDKIDQLSPRVPSTLPVPEPKNKRRVFVVHGRNLQAKESINVLLRAIDLDPIEWDEAIQMTEEASPYNGNILDMAFANAQAAVILVTGDDMARLGTRYVTDHEDEYEKHLTKQARPNVLFEMGMAFGRYPNRTIIVEFGKTRPFTDPSGRNIIRFSDTPEFRKKLADRLKTAKCLVQIENKVDWLKAGDFSLLTDSPDKPVAHIDIEEEHRKQVTALTETVEALEKEKSKLREQLRDAQVRFHMCEATTHSAVVRAEGFAEESKRLKSELTRLSGNAITGVSPIPSVNADSLVIKSPDDFLLRFVLHETSETKGFWVMLDNNRLKSITQWSLRVLTGQSFDSNHNDWRENRLNTFQADNTKPIAPTESGEAIWFLRKDKSNPQLLVGNDNIHPLLWPQNDRSTIQRWLLKVEVIAHIVKDQNRKYPLGTVNLSIIAEWDTSTNMITINSGV